MADRAGCRRVVLVHFRADLQERIDRACAARPGALSGRPGLGVEVAPWSAASSTDRPAGSGSAGGGGAEAALFLPLGEP